MPGYGYGDGGGLGEGAGCGSWGRAKPHGLAWSTGLSPPQVAPLPILSPDSEMLSSGLKRQPETAGGTELRLGISPTPATFLSAMSLQPGSRPGPEKACEGALRGQIPGLVSSDHSPAGPGWAQGGRKIGWRKWGPQEISPTQRDTCSKGAASGQAPPSSLTKQEPGISPLPTPAL